MDSTDLPTPTDRLAWDSISSFLNFWLQNNPLTGMERQVFNEYYTNYLRQFSPYVQHHFAAQTSEITAAIRARTRPRLLEVGAGCGTESLWFALLGADVTAVDLVAERLAVARARRDWLQQHLVRKLSAEFLEVSLFDFDTPRGFDLIWLEQTFHHLEPREQVYDKLFSLLDPNGTLFICECNAWNLPLQLHLLLRRGLKTKTYFVDAKGRRLEYGNERITTPSALRRGLESAGFEIKSTRPHRLLPTSNPPEAWLHLENSILKILPFLSTHFNIVACKKGSKAPP